MQNSFRNLTYSSKDQNSMRTSVHEGCSRLGT